ncbi:bile salt-activated lipase-like [Dorcoceras hygrometricum]|uniref:Bile salt-activated lipase-like n=1 Tax=Dorcoceras hygrometricum TaxID=472368 RepID=A0A2Z7DC82_9LAMI|nr:bile salt-activated lipase-like [Dorcoceras hygrometricum]
MEFDTRVRKPTRDPGKELLLKNATGGRVAYTQGLLCPSLLMIIQVVQHATHLLAYKYPEPTTILRSHQLAPSVGTKKESENAAKEEQSAIVENIDVQEEADDTGTSINQRKTLNLVGNLSSLAYSGTCHLYSGREPVISGLLRNLSSLAYSGTCHLYCGREPVISTLVGNLSSLAYSGTCDLYSGREPVISTLVGNLSSLAYSGTCHLYSGREPVISGLLRNL